MTDTPSLDLHLAVTTATGEAGSRRQPRWVGALALLAPFAVYLAGAALLGDWIIDDAGISYAYARNLAAGFGFVSQPGRPPVEGFSNFLWVMLLAPCFALHCFHPILTAKALGALLVLWSFSILQRVLRAQLGTRAAGVLATLLIATAPPIVIWTTSGLENSLTMLLAVALYARLVEQRRWWEVHSGVLAGLLAMTHPEGALFFAAGALVLLVPWLTRLTSWRATLAHLLRYGGAFGALFGPFMAFRLYTFGLPFPHTYYAKRVSPSLLQHLADLARHPAATWNTLVDLARGIGGPLGPAILLLSVAVALSLGIRGTLQRGLGSALAVQLVAIAAYVWLDKDWMREYRFATVATVFSLVVFVMAGFSVVSGRRGRRWLIAAYATAALVLDSGYLPRVVRYAANPPTPFSDVARKYAFKFNTYADLLGLAQASVFLPDTGATLYYSHLTVYDAAGLFEPDVVRTLKKGTVYWLFAHPEFYDYIFEQLRPTFINTHDFFTYITTFELDPRFGRDYVAINEHPDDMVRRDNGRLLHSGEYVRRDVLHDPGDIERLRSGYRSAPHPEPLVDRIGDRLAVWRGAAPDPGALIAAALESRFTDDNPNRAAALLQRARALQPEHYGATYQLAAALDAAYRLDEARPLWELVRAMAAAAHDDAVVRQAGARLGGRGAPTVDELMGRGLAALYQQHDAAAAVIYFRSVLALQPTHYGARYQLAAALDAAGRRDAARPVWVEVLERATSSGDAATAAVARTRLQ